VLTAHRNEHVNQQIDDSQAPRGMTIPLLTAATVPVTMR
jgi:hypothetical protein